MGILDFLFPKRCLGCGKIGKYFCENCRKDIDIINAREPARSDLDGVISFFRYDGIIREAIKALKYRFISDLAAEFISLIPTPSLPISQSSVLVPIPLHPSRLRYRGFNQAELLGKLVAKKLNVPVGTDILIRTRKTTPQVEMKDRKKRLENMKNVFALNNVTIQQFNNVFLFDDVFTTGATMRSAASVLKKAGFKKVLGVTMAK